ncbi:hypothetical protein M9H77_00919 [Catharanthus roseus]|uniref:Uncharacterized protein n=1 Tax=Catharanthus roseus TaxID=4058 RepID=A0ACC0C4C7_CATRO|nr:hypothetical protein M9H77_00919 [Catharanthus roseus]
MSGQPSTSKEQQKPPLFTHVFGARRISLSSSVSPTIILGGGRGEANQLKIARNHFSSSTSSSAAAVLISENADLRNEIFLRLPPKSLLRFQCVSKLWLSAISNPNFRQLHCRRFPTSSDADSSALFFIPNTASQAHFIALSEEDVKPIGTLSSGLSKFLDKGICHIHYCNGLFCLKSSVPIGQGEVIVYNPSTNIYRCIPDSKIAKYIKPEDIAINITYDPLISDHYKLAIIVYIAFSNLFFFIFSYNEPGGGTIRIDLYLGVHGVYEHYSSLKNKLSYAPNGLRVFLSIKLLN